jgi:hypothetical protein
MNNQVRIPIPVPEEEGDELDLRSHFQELANLEEGSADFRSVLDLSPPTPDDSRVTLSSIDVTEVERFDDCVAVSYDVEWSAYYGCSDVDGPLYENGLTVTGFVEGDSWVFRRHVYPERPSPNEEL